MQNLIRIFASFGLMCFLTPGWGHHSGASYDFSQSVSVDGTVKVFEARNPHIRLILEVSDEAGNTKDIEYEGHSRNNVFRRGWRPDDVDVGDQITIGIAPLSSGSDEGGYVTSVKAKSGKEF